MRKCRDRHPKGTTITPNQNKFFIFSWGGGRSDASVKCPEACYSSVPLVTWTELYPTPWLYVLCTKRPRLVAFGCSQGRSQEIELKSGRRCLLRPWEHLLVGKTLSRQMPHWSNLTNRAGRTHRRFCLARPSSKAFGPTFKGPGRSWLK